MLSVVACWHNSNHVGQYIAIPTWTLMYSSSALSHSWLIVGKCALPSVIWTAHVYGVIETDLNYWLLRCLFYRPRRCYLHIIKLVYDTVVIVFSFSFMVMPLDTDWFNYGSEYKRVQLCTEWEPLVRLLYFPLTHFGICIDIHIYAIIGLLFVRFCW